jgi:hypothetical protein
MGVQKIRNFTLISNWGFLSLFIAPIKSKSKKLDFVGTFREPHTGIDLFPKKKILDPI